MTTLVSLVTKDSIVLGCDSLGTVTKPLIDPFELVEYFDTSDTEIKLKLDENLQPLLRKFSDVYEKAREYPHNHMTHMEKLFSLSPLKMGIMTAGIASLGNRTVKSLISEFRTRDSLFKNHGGREPNNYTIKSVSEKLLRFLKPFYLKEFPETNRNRPSMELLLGGYSKREQIPAASRITLPDEEIDYMDGSKGEFGILFAGQFKEIARVIFGTDGENKRKVSLRHAEMLYKYHQLLTDFLKKKKVDIELPTPDNYIEEVHIFAGGWDLDRFNAPWGDFSEQNTIECVNWLVEMMCRSQQFSSALPTVGGEINMALITKGEGFRYVSKREYQVGEHAVPKEGGA